MPTKSDSLLSAWGAFFVAHALSVQKIERSLSESAPLTLYEYDLLLTIQRSPAKQLRFSELASRSIFTKSGITRIMKRLESRGFISRSRCESDGRGAFVQLSKAGTKALNDTWTLYSKEILKIFDPALTQSEAKEFEKMLGKIIDAVAGSSLVQIGSKDH